MATTITVLDTSPGFHEDDWTLNITASDVSTATDIMAAAENTQYGVKGIVITALAGGTEWVRLLNGSDPLIGPVILNTGTPWSMTFDPPIYCDEGNALKIQTQSAIGVHCLIKGITGLYPEKASSPSPADEATGVGASATLSWTVSESVVSNDVYFGTSSPPDFIGNQVGTTYSPSMAGGTTYYWRIDTKDDGSQAEGDVWSFTTA